MRVASFSSAFAALPGTTLLTTMPRRMAERQVAAHPWARLVEAPEEFDAFPYGMVWHARLESDPMHSWLRRMIRAAAEEMTSGGPRD